MIVAVEGIDGSGKTTLAQALSQWLRDSGYAVVTIQHPGHTGWGRQLRQHLHKDGQRYHPNVETFLYAADVADAQATVVDQATADTVIVADRWWFSSVVYQGALDGGSAALAWRVSEAAAYVQPYPDILIFLRQQPQRAYELAQARGDDAAQYTATVDTLDRAAVAYEQVLQRLSEIKCVPHVLELNADLVVSANPQGLVRLFEEYVRPYLNAIPRNT